ncbi:MAG: hypothetical protein WDW38_006974 [Sanguina aurantia]
MVGRSSLKAGVSAPAKAVCRVTVSRTHRSQTLSVTASAAVSTSDVQEHQALFTQSTTSVPTTKLRVLVAGAGIGGLVLAVSLLKQGFDVQMFERDVTAIRGEGKYRGPIQVQSNALAALEAIDQDVADQVLDEGCITGDRINGLCDGVTGDWYVKFDTFHPAVDKGLPVTRVISRILLQEILSDAVTKYGGPQTIAQSSHVVNFEEYDDKVLGRSQVAVDLEDGRRFTGDMLIGADGIWSKIRKQMIGETEANYSEYTCYTGISDFLPADIDIVGYRVFLGNKQYFVSSDVGGGKMQWYAFHKEAAGGSDPVGTLKVRLLELFGHWNDNVVDLIKATPEEDVLRRDIYDRAPIFSWAKGRVALLGDSAHAMQPNLGQGGCMAIEDGYELADMLARAVRASPSGTGADVNVQELLISYQNDRMMRCSTIHGMARSAAIMASTYKAYLGESMGPGMQWLTDLKIPHPGKVVGQVMMKATMPAVLDWVLGGNADHLSETRAAYCRLSDKPKSFDESDFEVFMNDDVKLIAATKADWLLICERKASGIEATNSSWAKGVYINEAGCFISRTRTDDGSGLLITDEAVSAGQHARIWREGNEHFVQDLGSANGTWLNKRRLATNFAALLQPSDKIEFGRNAGAEVYKVKLQHTTLRNEDLNGERFNTLLVGRRSMSSMASMASMGSMDEEALRAAAPAYLRK